MDPGSAGAVLVVAWVLVYLGCRVAKRPMPWSFWLLGGGGCLLFAFRGNSRPFTWLVLAALCLVVAAFAWLGSRWRRNGQPSSAMPSREEDLEEIAGLVDAPEGRIRDPQAAYEREASSLRIGLWIAAVFAGLGVAALEWVKAHIRGEVGFGGIVFLAAIALPLVLAFAFLVAAIQSFRRMRGLRRRMADEARAVGEDNLESGR